MRISTEKTSIEVDFVDSACGCRRTVKLETSSDGERVTLTSRSYREEGRDPQEEKRVETTSAWKAMAAAILLLEV